MKEKFLSAILKYLLMLAVGSFLFYTGFRCGRVVGYHAGYHAGYDKGFTDGWEGAEKDATVDWGEWR